MTATPVSAGGSLSSIQLIVSFASFGLLIFTAILSYYSYSAQARTGIRESLEQLDDIEITTSYKLKTILHDFNFGLISPSASLLIKLYKTQHNEAAASVPVTASDKIDEDMKDSVHNQLEEEFPDLLDDSTLDEAGIHFELSTRNAVKSRRFANQAMTIVRNEWLE